jgi:hypothetical protein
LLHRDYPDESSVALGSQSTTHAGTAATTGMGGIGRTALAVHAVQPQRTTQSRAHLSKTERRLARTKMALEIMKKHTRAGALH